MKNVTLSCLLLAVLGAGFLAGAWYNQRERVSAAALHSDAGQRADPEVGPYRSAGGSEHVHSPAHVHSPVVADLQVGPKGQIHVSPDKQQLIGVRVAAVEKKTVNERLRLYGRVAPDETGLHTINVGIDGFIRQLAPVTTGSHVRKDQWLATFSAPEARGAIQGYLVTLDVLDRARKSADDPLAIDLASAGVQQSRDRLLTLGMSSEQIAEIARTRQVPANLRIAAPEDGFILARNVSTGQKLERGDELFRIADLRRVWILTDVFGRDADYVKRGAIAEVFLPGRTRSFRARVSRDVLPQFDAGTQAVTVRLEADNPDYLLRPDMFVDVELLVTLPPAVAVPVEAVLNGGLHQTVFVEKAGGVFEPRHVETGWRFGQHVEIVSGLRAGERVVVSGTFLLDSESRLRPAVEKAAAQ